MSSIEIAVHDFMSGRSGVSDLVNHFTSSSVLIDDYLVKNNILDSLVLSKVNELLNNTNYDDIHKTLNTLSCFRFSKSASIQEFSTILFKIRRSIEDFWLSQEIEKCRNHVFPDKISDFNEWFISQMHSHPAGSHPLYSYISDNSDLDGFTTFIYNESTVDARFDNLLSMLQLSFNGNAKMEIARNYWDELGNGNPERVHTLMFNRIFEELNFQVPEDDCLDVSALACGNLLLMYVSYHSFSSYAIGALGITEALAPTRFTKVLQAGKRLGINEHALEYFYEHISIDDYHTEGWLKNVIAPTLNKNPDSLTDICIGVLTRLNTSYDYCESLLKKIKIKEL